MVHSLGLAGMQLGLGVYLTPRFRDWENTYPDPDVEYWDCQVVADRAAWNAVRKAWIPQRYWFNGETTCSILWFDFTPTYREHIWLLKLPAF